MDDISSDEEELEKSDKMTLTLQVKVTVQALVFTKEKLFQWFIYI